MADSITFKFLGGERFIVDLRAWKTRIQAQMRQKAWDSANRAVSLIANDMPWGDMRFRLRAYLERETADTFAFRVHSPSPVSNLWEFGTKPRTVKGGNRTIYIKNLRAGGSGFRRVTPYRGVMPKAQVFVNTAIAERAKFHINCRAILEQPVPEIGPGTPDVIGSL